jgi:UDP-N-acetylmuramoylalanine--D-glutamate ligase
MLLVLGVGIVGKAVIQKFSNVCFFDDKVKEIDGVPFFENWDNIEKIIVSPGIPLDHNIIQEGLRRGIPFTNDVGLFLDKNPKGFKIGITGTNGKSTTCALLKEILGDDAEIGGNFGKSPLLFEEKKYYIIELSSFQLEVLDKNQLQNLDIGVIINISPTHISRHGSFDDYVCAKSRILCAKKRIVSDNDFFAKWEITKAKMPKIFPDNKLFEKSEYRENWAIIESILSFLEFDIKKAFERAKNYRPLKNRQEIICQKPITIINDSKATNPEATKAAFKNMESDFIWIAGGFGVANWENFKQDDLIKVKKAFIIGENPKEFIKFLNEKKVNFEYTKTLDNTVQKAIEYAIKENKSILFSPAFSSYDQFENFEARGEFFTQKVLNFLAQNDQ